MDQQEAIEFILRESKTIAVVGLSPNPLRPSNGVARYLQSRGYRIVPVNPNVAEVLGEKAYPDLTSVPVAVDVVDVFRRPEHVPAIVDAAIAIGAIALWLQDGVVHPEAEEKARRAGLHVVSDNCILREHHRRRPAAG